MTNIIDARHRFKAFSAIDTVKSMGEPYRTIDDINIILAMLWPSTTCGKNTKNRE